MSNSQAIAIHYSDAKKLPFISKIYIWSIILEPLLFFAVAEAFYGISTNISRLFQFIFLLLFFMKLFFLKKGRSKIVEIKNTENIEFMSNCHFFRPIIFNYKSKYIDVHHA